MRRLNNSVHSIDIGGYVFLMKNEQPLFVLLETHLYLPIFSTIEKLQQSSYYKTSEDCKVKQIVEGGEFLDSFQGHDIRIMIDPYEHEGNTRFMEIFLGDSLREDQKYVG